MNEICNTRTNNVKLGIKDPTISIQSTRYDPGCEHHHCLKKLNILGFDGSSHEGPHKCYICGKEWTKEDEIKMPKKPKYQVGQTINGIHTIYEVRIRRHSYEYKVNSTEKYGSPYWIGENWVGENSIGSV